MVEKHRTKILKRILDLKYYSRKEGLKVQDFINDTNINILFTYILI